MIAMPERIMWVIEASSSLRRMGALSLMVRRFTEGTGPSRGRNYPSQREAACGGAVPHQRTPSCFVVPPVMHIALTWPLTLSPTQPHHRAHIGSRSRVSVVRTRLVPVRSP